MKWSINKNDDVQLGWHVGEVENRYQQLPFSLPCSPWYPDLPLPSHVPFIKAGNVEHVGISFSKDLAKWKEQDDHCVLIFPFI